MRACRYRPAGRRGLLANLLLQCLLSALKTRQPMLPRWVNGKQFLTVPSFFWTPSIMIKSLGHICQFWSESIFGGLPWKSQRFLFYVIFKSKIVGSENWISGCCGWTSFSILSLSCLLAMSDMSGHDQVPCIFTTFCFWYLVLMFSWLALNKICILVFSVFYYFHGIIFISPRTNHTINIFYAD